MRGEARKVLKQSPLEKELCACLRISHMSILFFHERLFDVRLRPKCLRVFNVECRISVEFLEEKLYLICTRNLLSKNVYVLFCCLATKTKISFCSRANSFQNFPLFLNLRRISDFMFRPKHSSQGLGGRVHPFDGNFPSFPPLSSFKNPPSDNFHPSSFLYCP